MNDDEECVDFYKDYCLIDEIFEVPELSNIVKQMYFCLFLEDTRDVCWEYVRDYLTNVKRLFEDSFVFHYFEGCNTRRHVYLYCGKTVEMEAVIIIHNNVTHGRAGKINFKFIELEIKAYLDITDVGKIDLLRKYECDELMGYRYRYDPNTEYRRIGKYGRYIKYRDMDQVNERICLQYTNDEMRRAKST